MRGEARLVKARALSRDSRHRLLARPRRRFRSGSRRSIGRRAVGVLTVSRIRRPARLPAAPSGKRLIRDAGWKMLVSEADAAHRCMISALIRRASYPACSAFRRARSPL